MHKIANSKCTILVEHFRKEYTSFRRCENERAKGHFREGEAFNEGRYRDKDKLLETGTPTQL